MSITNRRRHIIVICLEIGKGQNHMGTKAAPRIVCLRIWSSSMLLTIFAFCFRIGSSGTTRLSAGAMAPTTSLVRLLYSALHAIATVLVQPLRYCMGKTEHRPSVAASKTTRLSYCLHGKVVWSAIQSVITTSATSVAGTRCTGDYLWKLTWVRDFV